MFDFLRALDLTGEGAPFIGRSLGAAFAQAQAVVVLLTGDDEARLRPQFLGRGKQAENLTPQFRANVLFEAGMAFDRRGQPRRRYPFAFCPKGGRPRVVLTADSS